MELAIRAFERARALVASGQSATMAEGDLEAVTDLPRYQDLAQNSERSAELLKKTVVLKLNGGLGTGMGLEKAKSLLEVQPGVTFLDLMVNQVSHLRAETGSDVGFLLMNSQATADDTAAFLKEKAGALGTPNELTFVQNWVPKLDQESLEPVNWEADSSLEWCPPGHGDLYAALAGSGVLDRLLGEGIQYAFVSNSDNLGATLDLVLLDWFAKSGAPFAMEVTRRTESDKKGGHLAKRLSDGQLVLREVAQCADEDLDEFQNIAKHQFFNTNNIWIDLKAVKQVMDANDGVLPLPVIVNKKTVDPRDKSSTPVLQLEQAMGAAVECFAGAQAIEVPRFRFSPVKTTSDLLALRSDAYEVTKSGQVQLVPERQGVPPTVVLSSDYKFVDQMVELGVPSLVSAEKFSVQGQFSLAEGVVIQGKVSLVNKGPERFSVEAGILKDETVEVS